MSERQEGYLDGLNVALLLVQNVIKNERDEWGWTPPSHVRSRRERQAKLALCEHVRIQLTERRDAAMKKLGM